jgi:hypothetical protein
MPRDKRLIDPAAGKGHPIGDAADHIADVGFLFHVDHVFA